MITECIICNNKLKEDINDVPIKRGLNGKYCESCKAIRLNILQVLCHDRQKLKNHYMYLERELKAINILKERIKKGEDIDWAIKDYLSNKKYYWQGSELADLYNGKEKNEEIKKDEI